MFVAPVVACEISAPPTTPRGVARSSPAGLTTFMGASLVPGTSQARQAFGDLGRGVGGEGQAEGRAVRLAGEEGIARHERDVALERAPQQVLRVPAVGQPRP